MQFYHKLNVDFRLYLIILQWRGSILQTKSQQAPRNAQDRPGDPVAARGLECPILQGDSTIGQYVR